jgi:PAS domain S-box-containing protein
LDYSDGPVIFYLNAEGLVNSWPDSAQKLLGWTAKECVGRFPVFLSEASQLLLLKAIKQTQAGRPQILTFPLKTKQVKTIFSKLRLASADPDGKRGMIVLIEPVNFSTTAKDRTLLAELSFKNMNIPIIWVQHDGKISFANQAASQYLGYALDELATLKMVEIDPQWSFEDWKDKSQKILTDAPFKTYETTHYCKDGSEIPVEFFVHEVMVDEKKYFFVFITNLSQHKVEDAVLRESETMFRIMANATSASVLIYQGERLVYVNQAFQALSGFSQSELFAMKYWDFVHPDDREMVKERGQARQRGEVVPKNYYFRILTKHGKLLWMELNSDRILYQGKPAGLVIAMDVTEAKKSEQNIQTNLLRIEAMYKMGVKILAAQSPQDTARATLTHLDEIVPFYAARVMVVDGARGQIEVLAASCRNPAFLPILEAGLPIEDYASSLEGLSKGQITQIDDLQMVADKLVYRVLLEGGARSCLDVPLIAEGILLGVLQVAGKQAGAYASKHSEILNEVADLLAVALRQSQLLAAEQQRRNELERIEKISLALRAATSSHELYEILLHELSLLFMPDTAGVVMSVSGKYEVQSEDGIQFTPLLDSWLEAAIQQGRSVVLSNLGRVGAASAVVLPLQSEQKKFGALVLTWQKRHEIIPNQVRVLDMVAQMTGIALARLQVLETLEQSVRDRTREIMALYEIVRLYVSMDDTQAVISSSLQVIINTLHSKLGIIHLKQPGTSVFKMVACQGAGAVDLQEDLRQDEQGLIWHQPVDHDKPTLRLKLEPGILPAKLYAMGLGNYIGAPIHSAGEVAGVISLFYNLETGPALEDLSLISMVADQLGFVLERSSLRQQARNALVLEERQRLARELHDSVTQTMYSLTLMARGLRRMVAQNQIVQLDQNLELIQETAQQALKEMRLLIYELAPASVERQGVVEVIRERLEQVEKRAGVEWELKTSGDLNLSPQVQLGIYRISQEALNNALKHGSASRVEVCLQADKDKIHLSIRDFGQGFDPQTIISGMGLKNMRERALELDGQFLLESAPGAGTLVSVEFRRKNHGKIQGSGY